jgi:hypothetical protein
VGGRKFRIGIRTGGNYSKEQRQAQSKAWLNVALPKLQPTQLKTSNKKRTKECNKKGCGSNATTP